MKREGNRGQKGENIIKKGERKKAGVKVCRGVEENEK